MTMKIVRGNGKEITSYIRDNKSEIIDAFETPGALLLREFDTNQIEIDEVARLIGYTPAHTYIPGIAPRKAAIEGNPFVFTSTEAPPHLPILPHTEMTYWPDPPHLILFQCKFLDSSCPQVNANETVLFDMKLAAAELNENLLEKLANGCIMERKYPGKFNPNWDIEDSIAGGSCWQKAFATENIADVESICKLNNVEFEWISTVSKEPPTLVTRYNSSWYVNQRLVLQTPLLGKAVYQDMIKRFPQRFDNQKMHGTVEGGSVAPKVDLLHPNIPGKPFLEESEIVALMEALWKHVVFIEWEKGDVVLIDNMNMAHGRMNCAGKRRIVASMAHKR
eukprot:TCONS_00014672-protein